MSLPTRGMYGQGEFLGYTWKLLGVGVFPLACFVEDVVVQVGVMLNVYLNTA